MKQVQKTPAIIAQLRASYGPSASIDDLAVFKTVLLNSLPLRKSSGLYKGAISTVEMLAQMAAAVNAESIPINAIHGETNVNDVVGRLFAADVEGAQLVGLMAVDGKSHPDLVIKLDNGTIDQVSVGVLPSSVQCSSCGFDFLGPDATLDNVWSATCANDHVMGTDGIHANLNGLDLFYELSLVPMGAAQGARIVDPSSYSEPLRLAASAKGAKGGTALAVELSATPKEPTVDITAFTTAITASATENANLTASVTAKAAEIVALTASLATATATITTLEAAAVTAAAGDLATTKADLVAAQALVASATEHLTGEAKKILTACGVTDHSVIPTDIPGITALIDAKRAQFAAAIPINGAAASSTALEAKSAPRPTGAFSVPSRP